jgi:hypothetical protein
MPYFTHHFTTTICLHPVGAYHYTVVHLPSELANELPFDTSPRLRVEADVSGLPVRGAWQPADIRSRRWYLMLPKAPLKKAGLAVGSEVAVGFRLLPQDQVDLPAPLAQMLASQKRVAAAWHKLSAGKQRALAHMVASAKTAPTVTKRLEQVRGVILGELPEPWKPRARAAR